MIPFSCACCGPADTPRAKLASLCDTCASGACDDCNGLSSGAPYAGAGYIATDDATGSMFLVDDGMALMSPEWSYFLTLTSEASHV